MLKLFCIVVGKSTSFHVDIKEIETVSDLKDKIKEKKRSIECDADELTLYKVEDLFQDEEDNFLFNGEPIEISLENLISASKKMSSHSFISDHSFDQAKWKIHILVKLPDVGLFEPEPKMRKLNDISRDFPAPSSFAKCYGKGSWVEVCRNFKGQIVCHRLEESNDIIPITLLCKVFAKFEHNCSQIEFGNNDCKFVREFCCAMSKDYATEAELAVVARRLLTEYLLEDTNSEIIPIEVNKSTTDGSYRHKQKLILNLEVKLQKGTGGGDPTMQNVAYYVKQLPNITCQLPCILLDICGPLLSVFGITNVGEYHLLCEPLVTSLPLFYFDNVNLMTTLIRVCASLKIALKELRTLAEKPEDSTVPVKLSEFPYKNTAIINGKEVNLHDWRRIERYVFEAKEIQSGMKVIVKFAKQYGKEVHEFCANQQIAPKLLYYEILDSGWSFVVMEILDFIPLREIPCENFFDCAIENQLRNIQQLLQNADFVHGDLRSNNFCWVKEKNRVFVIDFDWSGKYGEAKYPAFMNTEDISWPIGAETNKLIRFEHDLYWIDKIVGSFSNSMPYV